MLQKFDINNIYILISIWDETNNNRIMDQWQCIYNNFNNSLIFQNPIFCFNYIYKKYFRKQRHNPKKANNVEKNIYIYNHARNNTYHHKNRNWFIAYQVIYIYMVVIIQSVLPITSIIRSNGIVFDMDIQ